MYKIYPWLILISAALCVIFLGGKRRAFGIFIAKLHSEFNDITLTELNWIGDSYAALGYLTTTLTTSFILFINRKYGLTQFIGSIFILLACITSSFVPNPHWLFLTHTIFHGIGSSFILSTSGLIVNEYFDKNHHYHILATTLVSGGSVASILFVEFYALLIDQYGWRLAFIILGIIYFIILFISSLIFRKDITKSNSYHHHHHHPNHDPNHDRDHHHQSMNPWNLCQLSWQHKLLLLLWTIDRIITSIVTYGMLLNLTDYVYQHETLLTNSILLTNLFASGEATTYIIGTILTGLTKNFLKNRLKYILILSSIGMSFGLILWEYYTYHHLISSILSYLCGFCLGPSITFLYPISEEMTLLPGYIAYPISLSGMGIGMLLSPILSALIAQTFKYRWFFLVQGMIVIIKCICLLCSWKLLNNLMKLMNKQQMIIINKNDNEEEKREQREEQKEKQEEEGHEDDDDDGDDDDHSFTSHSETHCLISPMTQKRSHSKRI
uniref:Putative monocarboxylate transporter n=1 Tax=Schistosoma mansoni TaxID=6183 RepID=A0A3Q0KLR4_SCHMA